MPPASDRTFSYDERREAGDREFPAPYLVVALECARPLVPPARLSVAEVDEVSIGRGPERGHSRHSRDGRAVLRVDIPDGWMSSEHARLDREAGQWWLSDCGSKNGTYLDGRRIDRAPLPDRALIEAGGTIFLHRSDAMRSFREPADVVLDGGPRRPDPLATLSIGYARELAALRRVVVADVPIVLSGETGTGKEVIARTVHELSGRAGPFVAINCGALPASLIESELFGYRKGAFSGATEDRPGLIRTANFGTLFLDEIAELPEPSQVKLLRVLQESEVMPIGGTQPVKVDIRVVSATHQDLAARVEQGSFRKDLWARLAGFLLHLPPLRERREDLGALIATLLPRVAGDAATDLRLQRAAGRALFVYDWPLNIRELEQALAAAVALAPAGEIALAHLPPPLRAAAAAAPTTAAAAVPRTADDDELRGRLMELLTRHQGNVSAVARDLGKARVQIRRWCRRFKLDPDDYR